MCAIMGSFSRSMYDILLEANKNRGNFAYSHCIYGKHETPFHISRFDHIVDADNIKDVKGNVYYFGHYQAPTSDIRKWSEKTSHPFEAGEWIVAHNGVINNVEEVVSIFSLPQKILVDTSVIPFALDKLSADNTKSLLSLDILVKTVLENLKGTFSLWIIHKKSKRAFLARQGSILYVNTVTGSFSSVECKSKDWITLPEGYIYEIDLKKGGIVPANRFETKSPFIFIPEE